MLKTISALGLALATSVTMTAAASAATADQATAAFLKQAYLGNEQEIQDAKGQTSDSDASVRYFAKKMIHDHTQAVQKIEAVAQQDNVSLPSPPAPGPKVSGATYMHLQVTAHENMLAMLKKAEQDGGQVKTLSSQLIPVVQQHLAMAQQFEKTGHIQQAGTSTM